MGYSSTPSAASRDLTGSQVVAALVIAGVAGLFVASLLGGQWAAGAAPFPYVWRDVFFVCFLCAVPFAWIAACFAYRRLGAGLASLLGAVLLGVSLIPLLEMNRTRISMNLVSDPWLGVAVRSFTALAITLALLLGAFAWPAQRSGRWESRHSISSALVSLLVLLVLPWTYVGARCRKDADKVAEFLEQSRIGEARTLANAMLILDATQRVQGRPIAEVAADIDKRARDLESNVEVRPGMLASVGVRLQRAEHLAMLGRTDEAISALKRIREPAAAPYVLEMLATVHETREEWDQALVAYNAAKAEWEGRQVSPLRSEGLLRATKGIAFCLRKSGRYVDAETAYQELLTLAPTAETHFLLAQFYEDAQQAEKARIHALRAIELDPDQYRQRGEKLITKLKVFHFGCLGVFLSERNVAGTRLER